MFRASIKWRFVLAITDERSAAPTWLQQSTGHASNAHAENALGLPEYEGQCWFPRASNNSAPHDEHQTTRTVLVDSSSISINLPMQSCSGIMSLCSTSTHLVATRTA